MGITIEHRTDYVRNITKLSLWYGFKNCRDSTSFIDFVTCKTPVFRLTGLWDGKNFPLSVAAADRIEYWYALLGRIYTVFTQEKNLADSTGSERQGLDILWPVMEPGIKRDVEKWPWIPSCYGVSEFETGSFGFFLYEFADSFADEKRIELHMGNIFAPDAPMIHLDDRANELADLIRDARERAPDVKYIFSESWFNSHPKFMTLFPDEWQTNPLQSSLAYSYNWWGQFVSREGKYHVGNGERFRETGEFPYLSMTCQCSLDSLLDHLQKKAWKAS